MRFLYSFLFYLATPAVLLRLWWRGRRAPAYRQRIKERFGFVPAVAQPAVWIHAVSVGEVLAAVPLVKALQVSHPNWHFVITTATPTGADRVKAAFADSVSVTHFYMPYDLPDVTQRFLKRVQPHMLLIMETELWPNWFHYCAAKKIPIFIANARLSERSARGYQRLSFISSMMLQHVTQLAAQTEDDAQRFIQLGLAKEKIHITGSVKFDLEIADDLAERALAIRTTWNKTRPVWIAASTHEGEEQIILNAQKIIQEKISDVLFIWVPRHPERFTPIAEMCEKNNFKTIRRSQNISADENTQIYLGDTMGELLLLYATADVAFVGGSLIERGGQNPIEPAAIGLPILSGPHVFNFAAISAQLQKIDAERVVNNAEELAEQVVTLLRDDKERNRMGNLARELIGKNKGSTAKQVALIDQLLN